MNFCLRCQSLYAQPGTCNCFATTAPSIQPQPAVQPLPYVYPTITPSYPGWPGNPWQPAVTWGTTPNVAVPSTGNSTSTVAYTAVTS